MTVASQALCCLDGSTMSNLVHRRRRCARIVTYMVLLPGGQYARGWERSKYAGCPVGRRMCGILYPGCRFALPWAKCLLPFQGVYFAGLSSRTGVYPCLSPCDRCKNPAGVMMGLTENIQACLRIFRRAQHQWIVRDSCIYRKGFLMFLSYGTLPPQR